jgi:hypothetical protein
VLGSSALGRRPLARWPIVALVGASRPGSERIALRYRSSCAARQRLKTHRVAAARTATEMTRELWQCSRSSPRCVRHFGEELAMRDQVGESTASAPKSGIYERVASYASEHPMVAATTFVLVITVIAFVVTSVLTIDEGLRRSLYTVYCGFLFTGFIGGIVKMMMDNVATARLKRADDAAFVANVLDDLKTVHDCVNRAAF